jgi:magnesium-transporting ATPase (P-type)
MIEAAVILSGVVRRWPDFFIILVLLVANAVVGFWEERQAGNAIDALKAKLAIKARVKRDGKWVNPAARDLVPGYDNVHYKDEPEAWNMRLVLGVSTVLGIIGVVSAFLLFYLGEPASWSRPTNGPIATSPT